MEKIEDIVKEMREKLNAYGVKCFGEIMYSRGYLADRIEAAHRREIEKLRALVEGLLDAATTECATCDYDCGPNRENCICRQARGWLDGGATPKTVSGVDKDALELSKKLMAVLGEMVQWKGVLSEDEEDLLKALVRYTESMKEGEKE